MGGIHLHRFHTTLVMSFSMRGFSLFSFISIQKLLDSSYAFNYRIQINHKIRLNGLGLEIEKLKASSIELAAASLDPSGSKLNLLSMNFKIDVWSFVMLSMNPLFA